MTKMKHMMSVAMWAGLLASARAAEGFEPRYNLAGSLGGEIFAPPDQTGWAVGAAVTRVPVRRVTGDDGQALALPVAGATLSVPGLPAAVQPSYGPGQTAILGDGSMTRTDIALAYLTTEQYRGGRFLFVLDLPYIRKDQHIGLRSATPALSWPQPVPPEVHAAVAGRFQAQYQDALGSQGAAATGITHGLGDAELMGGWQFVGQQWRLLGGASVILPTGKYHSAPQPDAGTGNFYTLRPALQAAYLPTSKVALGAKVSMGLNSRNHDNQLRSGNWFGVELAAGYMTPVGVIGLHALRVQQYQDDQNNPFGASRFRSTNAGAFLTTRLPLVDAIMTLQYIDTTASRNAKHGSFLQLRLIKLL